MQAETSIVILAIVCAGSSALLARQNPTLQGHPEDYVRADIEFGARLFTEQCAACHGEDGDAVAGVNLKSGKFKNAVTDPQLRTVITTGFPNAGMPAFSLNPSELTGLVAYLRNMNTFDRGSAMGRRCDARTFGVRRQGRLSQLSSGQQRGKPKGPRPERYRRDPQRRLARAIACAIRASQMMPINRPVRAVTRDGEDHQRPPPERRHLHGSVHRRQGPALSLTKADLA